MFVQACEWLVTVQQASLSEVALVFQDLLPLANTTTIYVFKIWCLVAALQLLYYIFGDRSPFIKARFLSYIQNSVVSSQHFVT